MRLMHVIYPQEKINAAKSMHLRRITPQEIARELNIGSVRTVYNWIDRFGWNDILVHENPIQALERRLMTLSIRENKTSGELLELDSLVNNIGKLKKIYATNYEAKPEQVAAHSEKPKRERGKGKPIKNDISALTAQDFESAFNDKTVANFFDYQLKWRQDKNDKKKSRQRFYLKSRQIGATYYFAAEAFEDAVLTGDNQLFISASRAQAEIFRAYIIGFAKAWFGIELTGNPLVLSNGAQLHFLSTNSSTAQGYHGHVYYDEVFWTNNWKKLQNLSSGMAMQKKYRKTYFSIPSTKQHAAYQLWSGEKYNDGRKNKASFEFTDEQLRDGVLGDDGIYRQKITVMDAIAGGFDLVDMDQLDLEYSKDEYANQLMCEFIDSAHGVFSLKALERGMVDACLWKDFDIDHTRPYGNLPVWIGYDPSRTTDNAAVVVIAPPLIPGGKFRLLEKHRFVGQSFQYQANRIKDLCDKYNVERLAIDITGIGYGVYDLVRDFYPMATPINYNVEVKNGLVIKAIDVFANNRFQYDASYTDIAQAFMCIRRSTTPGGQVTYSADRTEKNGHADFAFAIMHALVGEPFNTNAKNTSTWDINDE